MKIHRLRTWPTVLGGIILFLGIAFVVATSLFLSPVLGVPYPEKGLARVAERTMQLREELRKAPAWEQRLHAFWDPSLGTPEEIDQMIEWHREIVRLAKDPAILANLPGIMTHVGVLEGESGRLEFLEKQTRNWLAKAPDPVPAHAMLLRSAYFEEPPPENWTGLLHELLPPDWFRDRLEERTARKSGEAERAEALHRSSDRVARRLFWRYRFLTGLDLAVFFLFGMAAVLFLKLPRGFWKVGPVSIPPPWPVPAGMALMVRGCALGVALSFAFAFLPGAPHPAGMLFSYLLWTLPVVWLFHRVLLRPNGLSLRQEMGLSVPAKDWGKLALIALLGLGIDSLGGWLIGAAGWALELPNHWAESFDADLVFGSRAVLACSLAGIVGVGPFFEEMVFRGFLYGTLRGRLGATAAGLVSAGVFSLVHGYGLVGCLTVFWSGVAFAWVYEKSGSLWPCVAAHAAGNLLYSVNVIWMLRI